MAVSFDFMLRVPENYSRIIFVTHFAVRLMKNTGESNDGWSKYPKSLVRAGKFGHFSAGHQRLSSARTQYLPVSR